MDAEGNRIEHEIDVRGRVWRKTVKRADGMTESQSTFTFDTADWGTGQLAHEEISGQYGAWLGEPSMGLDFSRSYSYDPHGRPLGSTTLIDGASYSTAVQYDLRGRPWKTRDASGQWTKTAFNPRGMVEAVCADDPIDAGPDCPTAGPDTYLTTVETDAWGHPIKERRGGSAAMDVTRSYWPEMQDKGSRFI